MYCGQISSFFFVTVCPILLFYLHLSGKPLSMTKILLTGPLNLNSKQTNAAECVFDQDLLCLLS